MSRVVKDVFMSARSLADQPGFLTNKSAGASRSPFADRVDADAVASVCDRRGAATLPPAACVLCPGPDTCETGPGRRMGPIPMKSEGRVRVSCGGSGATGAGDATPAKWPRPLVMNRSATSGSLSFLPRNPRSLNHAGPISAHPILSQSQGRRYDARRGGQKTAPTGNLPGPAGRGLL